MIVVKVVKYRSFQGNPKTRETNTRTITTTKTELKPLTATATPDIKHSQAHPDQLKAHAKDSLLHFQLLNAPCLSFNESYEAYCKRQEQS